MASTIRGSDNFDSATVLGVGQAWQDVTASRAIGTTYTNSTGRPIIFSVSCEYGTTSYANFNVGAVVVAQGGSNNATIDQNSAQIVVPAGATYSVTAASGTVTLRRWSELR